MRKIDELHETAEIFHTCVACEMNFPYAVPCCMSYLRTNHKSQITNQQAIDVNFLFSFSLSLSLSHTHALSLSLCFFTATPASNSGPLQGTVNVITIITTSSSSSSSDSSNSNSSNNNTNNINNNNNSSNTDNHSQICCESTLSPVAGVAGAEGAGVCRDGGGGANEATTDHSFVAIPLLERRRRSRSHSRCHIAPLAPIICIPAHPDDLTQLSRSVSCFVRFRRSCTKCELHPAAIGPIPLIISLYFHAH